MFSLKLTPPFVYSICKPRGENLDSRKYVCIRRLDDKEKSGDSPRRTVKFSLSPAVVVVLKKLPCPDNLLIPQIRQQLSRDDFCTFLSGVFGDLVDIFLCFLHGELTGM